MKAFPRLLSVIAACCVLVPPLKASAEGDELKFKVQGTNPGGKGGYTGEVSIHKTSAKDSATIKWVTGANKDVTEGVAIKSGKVIGAGYGGKAFYAIAVYHIHGAKIHASWALSTSPEQLGEYELKGVDFDGKCTFADGSPGSVTFTEGKDGAFKVSWDLPSGHYDGIGLRVKDSLVAVSGAPSGGFGVVAMEMGEETTNGVWTMAGMGGVGKEVWTMAGGASETAESPPVKASDKGKDMPPELIAAISADMKRCGETAEKFMGLLKAGKTADAVALMSDTPFKNLSREDFVKALEKSNKVFGPLQSFTPDKDATDFGVKDGVMTFTLQADAQYENAKVRETLRFIRNSKGEVEFVGYNRTAKQ
jgi:hypothetical protein